MFLVNCVELLLRYEGGLAVYLLQSSLQVAAASRRCVVGDGGVVSCKKSRWWLSERRLEVQDSPINDVSGRQMTRQAKHILVANGISTYNRRPNLVPDR